MLGWPPLLKWLRLREVVESTVSKMFSSSSLTLAAEVEVTEPLEVAVAVEVC